MSEDPEIAVGAQPGPKTAERDASPGAHPDGEWRFLQDETWSEVETAATDAVVELMIDSGAGVATVTGSDRKGTPLGAVSVASVNDDDDRLIVACRFDYKTGDAVWAVRERPADG